MDPTDSRDRRIADEIARISIYFEDVPENQRAIALPLIQNAAFMKVTLEDLQEIIKREGVTETYQNGANQFGVKQSASLQSYNALVKNYAAVVKTLDKLLPYMSRKINFPTVQPVMKNTEAESCTYSETFEEWEKRVAKEKSLKEIEAEARAKRIRAEIEQAAEWQRKQRELEKQ